MEREVKKKIACIIGIYLITYAAGFLIVALICKSLGFEGWL